MRILKTIPYKFKISKVFYFSDQFFFFFTHFQLVKTFFIYVLVGEWVEKKNFWCNKGRTEALTFELLTVDQCKRKCLELTNGECKAVQYIGDGVSSICAYCDNPDEIKAAPNRFTSYVYQRGKNKTSFPCHNMSLRLSIT